MVEKTDIHHLLNTGQWTSSRVRSRSPTPARYPSSNGVFPTAPSLDPQVPRSLNILRTGSKRPPAPSVEDEADALAKEHGESVVSFGSTDEEPKSRGSVEQYPILELVHEFNPERGFVIVSDPSSEAASEVGVPNMPESAAKPAEETYEANTCRKFVVLPQADEKRDGNRKPGTERTGTERPGIERKKSRQDLPPIETNLRPQHPSQIHRSKSATVDQPSHDYFSNRPPSRDGADGRLSPSVKHSTKGRDRAYWDIGSGSADGPRRRPDSRRDYDERRRNDSGARPYQSSSPAVQRRTASTVEVPKTPRRFSNERYRDEVPSPRYDRRNTSPISLKKGSPPRHEKRTTRSPSRAGDRTPVGSRSSSYKRSSLQFENRDDSSSDESPRHRANHHRRRKSIIAQDERGPSLLTPAVEGTPVNRRPKSHTTSPLPSPNTTQGQFAGPDALPSPRLSQASFSSAARRRDRSSSPYNRRDASPPRSRSRVRMSDRERERNASPRSHSKAASVRSTTSTSSGPRTIPIPIPIPAMGSTVSLEKQRTPIPPLHPRDGSLESNSSKSHWQPPTFDPTENAAKLDKPITSYRRFSEDISSGSRADLPQCPRTIPKAGYSDWYTIPRCESLNVCPSCYQSVFAKTSYGSLFVLGPKKPKDKPMACDFGVSPWYRIAWLLTLKNRQPDLRLLVGLASIEAKNQPCMGKTSCTRIWYSIKDPYTQRPVPDFSVCYSCAKTIEMLLPNLFGIFIPLESPPEPSRGVCAMRFSGGRKRFVLYFDLMETTSDKALSTRKAPNLESLANEVRALSLVEECWQDDLVRDRRWHTMQTLPDFTVCEECFDHVVWPELESQNAVARNFYKKPVRMPIASCQLYSARMRAVFKAACRRNDLALLEARARERLAVEKDIRAKIYRLDEMEAADDPKVDREIEKLIEHWKQWE